MDQLFSIVEWLKNSENINLSLFHFIQENPVYSARRVGNSVLVRGISDLPWVYIQSNSQTELNQLLKELRKDDNFFGAIEAWIVPYIIKNRKIIWHLDTNLFVLPEDAVMPEFNTPEKIYPLATKDAAYIFKHSHYKTVLSKDYIEDRIMKDHSSGISINGKLAAWILTHDDGAIGCLHVIEEYRKTGLASAVIADMIKKIRGDGRIPFVYIDVGNDIAEKLAEKLGFEKQKQMSWLCLN